jgi:aspartate dehydrogenase
MDDSKKNERRNARIAIVGLGPIGKKVARALDDGIYGMELSAISVSNPAKHQQFLATLKTPPQILPIAELSDAADIVVECAPSSLVESIVTPFVRQGKVALVLSASALLDNWHLVDIAKESGGQIVVPTGALLGLDAVTAAAEGNIASVRMITRKPVKGLLGAPHIVNNNIHIENIDGPMKVFEGSAREAGKGFPANLNVVVALSLAGTGPDRTTLEVWADPALTRNTHRIEVVSDSASFAMSIENIPSENPKTGLITALSVIAYLRKQRAPLRIGS